MSPQHGQRPKRRFRIEENPSGDERYPFALFDPDDVIVRVSDRPSHLSAIAFDDYRADEVRHDEDLIKAAQFEAERLANVRADERRARR